MNKHFETKGLFFLFLLFSMLWGFDDAFAEKAVEPKQQGNTYIISIPGLSFMEIKDSERIGDGFKMLVQNGQLGALNVRTPEIGVESGYASIGAGKQAVVKPYEQLQIQQLRDINEATAYRAPIGLLGDELEQHGIHRAVFGRQADLMLMDYEGEVDRLRATSVEGLMILLRELPAPSTVIVELTGLEELIANRQDYNKEDFTDIKTSKLREYDHFVQQIEGLVTEKDELWLISPLAHAEARQQRLLLTPIIRYVPGLNGGLLISSTTHRNGVISFKDVTPTILDRYHIKSSGEGQIIHGIPRENSLDTLLHQVHVMSQVYSLRPQLLYPFVTYQVVVLLISLAIFIWKKRIDSTFIRASLFSILSAPFILLCLGIAAALPLVVQTAVFLLSLVLVSMGLAKLPFYQALSWMGGLTVLSLLIDGMLGGWLMKRSVLGYDAMIGARYYGIGNEYMGVLIGSAVLAVSLWLHHKKSRGMPVTKGFQAAVGLFFLLILIFLAAPELGTNAGGAVSAAVVFGFFMIRMVLMESHTKISWQWWLVSFASFLGIGFTVLWTFNIGFHGGGAEHNSHIGRAMLLIYEGNFKEVGAIIQRKVSMNLHLLGVSAWSKLLLASILVLAVLTFHPKSGIHQRWRTHYEYLLLGFIANMIGALAVLAVNDSGIVAASTLIVFITVPMLLLKPYPMNYNRDSQSA